MTQSIEFASRVSGSDSELLFRTTTHKGPLCYTISLISTEGVIIYEIVEKDPVAVWRTEELLKIFPTLDQSSIMRCFWSAKRWEEQRDFKFLVDPVLRKVGWDSYNRIMMEKVPEEIVEEILSSQKNLFRIDISILEKEVLSGTVPWKHSFGNFITFPTKSLVDRREYRKLITKKAHPDSDACPFIEKTVFSLLDKYPFSYVDKRVVVALGATIAEFAYFTNIPNLDKKEKRACLDKIIKQNAMWLNGFLKKFPWSAGADEKSAEALIKRLFAEYYPQ